MAEQTLYRFFDDEGQLLYIGISINAFNRAKKHRQEKYWWPEVAAITLYRYKTRADVEEAERRAIKEEKPLYNKTYADPIWQYSPRPVPEQRKKLEALLMEYKLAKQHAEDMYEIKSNHVKQLEDHCTMLRRLLDLPTEISNKHG